MFPKNLKISAIIKDQETALVRACLSIRSRQDRQCPQGRQGIRCLDTASGMYGQIPKLDDKGQLSPGIVVHRKESVFFFGSQKFEV